MSLTPVDYAIIVVYLAGCVAAGVWMRRYIRNVEDFAVAGREMDLNLGIASLAATEVGIVTVMYAAELGFNHGFAGAMPGVFGCLAMLLIGFTGFIIVPMREAGVITIPELFEKRFGKQVRWLAGVVVILGGLLNMGIFLRMGGEFLLYCMGLSATDTFLLPGLGWNLPMLETMMVGLLALILLYTALGGMVSVLVTDYLQFLVMGLGIVVTSLVVLWSMGGDRWYAGWQTMVAELDEAHRTGVTLIDTKTKPASEDVTKLGNKKAAEPEPPVPPGPKIIVALPEAAEGKEVAMQHPFDPAKSWGWGWLIWQGMLQIAIMTTWQTTISRVLSARDARTAKRMYVRTAFYFVGRFGLPGLWGAAAFLFFWRAGGLPQGVGSSTALPVFLGHVMPWGLLGLLIAAMLAAEMSTDSGYMLTWATVIYNDIISPCLRTPLSSKTKLLIVRLLVLAIGVFLVFYGLLYKLSDEAWNYLAVTGNIYMSSMFTLLVAALYWRGAHRWGAMAAIVLGAIVPLAYVVFNHFQPNLISAELAGFASFGMAFAGMVFGSLLGRAQQGLPPPAAVE